MGWFLYDRDLGHERVKYQSVLQGKIYVRQHISYGLHETFFATINPSIPGFHKNFIYSSKPVVESTTVKKCEVKKIPREDAVFEVALLKSFCVNKEHVGENFFLLLVF